MTVAPGTTTMPLLSFFISRRGAFAACGPRSELSWHSGRGCLFDRRHISKKNAKQPAQQESDSHNNGPWLASWEHEGCLRAAADARVWLERRHGQRCSAGQWKQPQHNSHVAARLRAVGMAGI